MWGNPVYNWDQLQKTNFDWWIQRFQTTLQYVDVVRVDHFRGFQAYWEVPAGEETAINGEWIEAPGEAFFETLNSRLGRLPILAEDLGIITPEVEVLRDRFDFPGMRILMFAFSGDASNPYLPHHYIQNTIVYPGTHDNNTAIGWWTVASDHEKAFLAKYLGYDSPSEISYINWVMIRMAMSSVATWSIVALQDILGLDDRTRMNDPSQNAGNWRWRYSSYDLLSDQLSQKLRELTHLYSRSVEMSEYCSISLRLCSSCSVRVKIFQQSLLKLGTGLIQSSTFRTYTNLNLSRLDHPLFRNCIYMLSGK